MNLYELLKETDWNKVNDHLLFYCDNEGAEIYQSVYESILKISPVNTDYSDIFIKMEYIKEEDMFDVYGIRLNDNFKYSLSLSLWGEWLSYGIEESTLSEFDKNQIMAHCLWQMTYYGFTEKSISLKRDEILEMSKKVEQNQFVEEKTTCPFCNGTKIDDEDEDGLCKKCDEHGLIQIVSFI